MINKTTLKQKIVFIESNTTGTGKLFVEKALKKGHEVIFLATDVTRYPFLADLMVLPIQLDTTDVKKIVDLLKPMDQVIAVFSSSEYFISIAAQVALQLRLPGNDPHAISACRDKAVLAEKLIANNIATPISKLITTLDDAKSTLQSLRFPVVIKPASGSGSIGVKLCYDEHQYSEHILSLLLSDKNERGNTIPARILVQEYIQGPEYSVEVIAQHGEYHVLGVTQKYLSQEPYFVETGHDFPAVIDLEFEKHITDTVKRALTIMGLTVGAAHIELRYYQNKVYIIEINPRLAGGMIPALIQEALGIDVIDLVLNLYCNQPIDCHADQHRYASIRFIIPVSAGTIRDIRYNKSLTNLPGLTHFVINRSIGDTVTQYGDYRDRIGYVISVGDTIEESRSIANSSLKQITIDIDCNQSYATGRLKKTLHPDALQIVNNVLSDDSLVREFTWLSAINEAHLLMLMKQNIIGKDIIVKIIRQIQYYKSNNFSDIKNQPMLRGTYLAYESHLIESLGMEIAGVIHTGRSRNDINAILFKLLARDLYINIYKILWSLRQTILLQAKQYMTVTMPIYSQFQTALPGSYAYYLLAIESELARDLESFQLLYHNLMQSPLGAGAGAGTSFPIDPKVTANYLGFTEVNANALDAVASRDLALQLLSNLSITGTTLSRIAQDYQLWTTQEFSLFELPDELSGGSSMMPQKKNPYLLEKIKGKSILPTGQLMSMLAIMQKTPFSNSVEVGTEALQGFESSFKSIIDAATLLKLIIAQAKPVEENMLRSCKNGLTMSVCVTETLVKSGIPFREAHTRVGEAISIALDNHESPYDAICKLLPDNTPVIELNEWRNAFEFGGGCSQDSVLTQINLAEKRLRSDSHWLHNAIYHWNTAHQLRQREIVELLKN